jgi:AbrB family looped-hinge helix DNA binding protein
MFGKDTEMKSKITSKFQVTIPREIRALLKLRVSDSIAWSIEDGKVLVEPVQKPFLKYRGIVKVGPGDGRGDVAEARAKRAQRYR